METCLGYNLDVKINNVMSGRWLVMIFPDGLDLTLVDTKFFFNIPIEHISNFEMTFKMVIGGIRLVNASP